MFTWWIGTSKMSFSVFNDHLGNFMLATSSAKRETLILVGSIPTPLKNMSSSVGMMIPNWMESYKIPWFQTTNQYVIYH